MTEEEARERPVGEIADELYEMRAARQEAQKCVDEMKRQEAAVGDVLQAKLQEAKLTKAAGERASVSLRTSTVPTVESWEDLYAYVAREEAWDLLQRRLAAPAFRARWDDGLAVPGVGQQQVAKLGITKLGA